MAKPPVSNKSLLLIGDSLSFLMSPAHWSKKIMAQGPVVEASLAGKNAYFVWGAEGLKAFYDEKNVIRSTVHSGLDPFVFNNERNVSPVLDGEAHRIRKAILVAAHGPKHVEEYVNKISVMTEDFISKLKSELPTDGTFANLQLYPRLHEFEVQFMAKIFFSAEVDDTFQKEINSFLDGTTSVPINVPGFSHYKGRKASQSLLDFSRKQLAEHRANPEKYNDMMSILLKAEPQLNDEDVVIELQHFMFAITAIPIALCTSLTGTLLHKAVLEKARAEVESHKKHLAPGRHYDEKLISSKFAYCQHILKEALRTYPIIPLQQGNSISDFEVAGFKIPANGLVLAGFYATDLDPKVYPEPDEFRPERFETLKDVESGWFWAPFGAGPRLQTHRCAGQPTVLAVTTYLLAKLLSSFEFELVDEKQDIEHFLFRMPVPTGGMPVRVRPL